MKVMNRYPSVLVLCGLLSSSIVAYAGDEQACVVLLHGLARTHHSMGTLAKRLEQVGYKVVNQGYKSRKYAIEDLSQQTIPDAIAACGSAKPRHFVTHSLGGILLRQYLSVPENRIEHFGRAVMLGPPNQGSEVVDQFRKLPGFKLLNGPAGLQLGTGEDSLPLSLGPVRFELGVIAGTDSISFLLSRPLPKPHDGKVSVESTKVEGMSDHITLPVTHTFMMSNKDVISQVKYFLVHGRFERNLN